MASRDGALGSMLVFGYDAVSDNGGVGDMQSVMNRLTKLRRDDIGTLPTISLRNAPSRQSSEHSL